MGTQAEYWTDVYATTHEQRLAQSLEFARKELKEKYGAAETYAKYQQDLLKMYEEELGKAQRALLEYDEKRGGRQGSTSVDDTAKLLGVMADAGNTIARETGDAAQRRLEAEGSIESRYRLSGEQSNAVGRAGDYFAKIDTAAITTVPDVERQINNALAEIGPGTFPTGADQAKTGAAELYARLDRALSTNAKYQSNPSLKTYLATAVGQKMGVDPKYVDRAEVTADKGIAIGKAKAEVGVTGTATSREAAEKARQLIDSKLGGLDSAQKQAFGAFQDKYGGQYFDLIKEGATIGEAKAEIKSGLSAADAASFEKMFEGARTALAEVGDQDLQKFFDPGYVNAYSRSIKLGTATERARGDFAGAVEALKTPPTEEAARARGAEIYEPISAGLPKRTKEATTRLEERKETSRITGMPMSEDDFLASRLLQKAPQLPDDKRILAGASAAAIRALDTGWEPEGSSALAGRPDVSGADKLVPLTQAQYDALSEKKGPSAALGYRLYSNIKEKQLKDTTPKGIVQYAADLAGGDPGLRDAVLQEYFKYAGYDMRGTKVMKAREGAEQALKPPPAARGAQDIKETSMAPTSEEMGF